MSIRINEDYIGRRVDKFLRDNFGILQSKICILAKQKKILVNDIAVKFDYRLKKGDFIDVLDDCIKGADVKQAKRILNSSKKQQKKIKEDLHKNELPIEMVYKLKEAVVFEDDNVLVINKPYGLSVQGGTGVKRCLEDYFHILSDKKLRIVHRIDKDTRGLLILAKNLETSIKLTDMFKKREVHKKYLAILSGVPKKSSGTIKTYIFQSKEDNIAYNARNTEERMNGKEAITKYKVIKTNKKNKTALVEFFPITGRKHQIRLHAQHIKCPIVGDEKYGFEKNNKKLQLFAVSIDASPICKVELTEEQAGVVFE